VADWLVLRFCGDQHDAKVRSDGKGPRKEVENDVGRGAGGDVVVGGLAAEEQIADTAAGEISLVAGGVAVGMAAASIVARAAAKLNR
jgi:hypothetical protein